MINNFETYWKIHNFEVFEHQIPCEISLFAEFLNKKTTLNFHSFQF